MSETSARKFVRENMPMITSICRRYYSRVKKICSQDDLTQEVITRILTSDLDNTQKVLPYIHSIARNTTNDIIRKYAKNAMHEKEKPMEMSTKDTFSPDVFDELGISRTQLYEAISRLSPNQQRVIFSMLEEKSAEQIAKEMGVRRRTIVLHSINAISRLRKQFIKEGRKVFPQKRRPKM